VLVARCPTNALGLDRGLQEYIGGLSLSWVLLVTLALPLQIVQVAAMNHLMTVGADNTLRLDSEKIDTIQAAEGDSVIFQL
jgi:hypothetical protein